MPVLTSTITLSGTPQALGSSRSRRVQLTMSVDSGTAYVGGSTVTTATGRAFTSASPFAVYVGYLGDKSPGEAYFVVGTGVVRVMEIVS